ncbi:MAG TPA: hypothetical protein VEJ86_07005 [Candidatus Binataceae bacterium]|nr:hypothetical protein [Candidatus Binataceae bacterium]
MRRKSETRTGEKGAKKMMASTTVEAVAERHCRLLRPVRDHEGRSRFGEKPKILREVNNLQRKMFLVQFNDGATTFLFPDEIVVE